MNAANQDEPAFKTHVTEAYQTRRDSGVSRLGTIIDSIRRMKLVNSMKARTTQLQEGLSTTTGITVNVSLLTA